MNFMFNPYYSFNRNVPTSKTYKSLEEILLQTSDTLALLKQSKILNEYLLTLAPSIEYKEILLNISDDDIRHKNSVKEIYSFFTNEPLKEPEIIFQVPKSYKAGILAAKKLKMDALLFYKDLMNSITNEYYKGLVFELFTETLVHNDFYNYILISLYE